MEQLCQNCSTVNIRTLFDRKRAWQSAQKAQPSLKLTYTRIMAGEGPHIYIGHDITSVGFSAKRGCKLCKLIWQAVGFQPRDIVLVGAILLPVTIELVHYNTDCSWTILRQNMKDGHWPDILIKPFETVLKTYRPWNIDLPPNLSRHTILPSPSRDPFTPSHIKTVHKWISQCASSHTSCALHGTVDVADVVLPPRLIDVRRFPRDVFLLKSEDIDKRAGTPISYLALSYCWGKTRGHETTSLNFNDRLTKGIPRAELPQTIQDAIFITATLGYSYIWIDAICIIQNSKADWEANSELMGDIYANASCTIAASDSHDSSTGILKPLNFATFETQSALIKSHSSPSCSKRPQGIQKLLRLRHTNKQQLNDPCEYSAYFPLLEWEDLNLGPLEERGWVMQERVLSARRLCFTKKGIYWECSEILASEICPGGIPNTFEMNKLRGISTPNDPGLSWHNLVLSYSYRRLTYLTDRMPAFAGVAREYHRVAKGSQDDYLAGLWRSTLVWDLCWRATRVTADSVPSWSWHGTYNRIQWPSATGRKIEEAKILDAAVEPPNSYAKVDSGHICLEGWLAKIDAGWLGSQAFTPAETELPTSVIEKRSREIDIALPYDDELRKLAEEERYIIRFPRLYALLLLTLEESFGNIPTSHHLILLTPTENLNEFKRVGMLQTIYKEEFANGKREIIRIV